MSVTGDPLEFFEEANDASRHKLAILSKYLKPLAYKIGSGWPQLWIVDGFAGAGEYKPDANGVAQPGSPRITAVWAKDLERTRGQQVLRCINVESHPKVYETLRANLAPWKDLIDFRPGEFAARLDGILETIGAAPAFFFLDPFGVNGIEMHLLERILARPSHTTELLIHFSDKSFKRMAGHLDDNERRSQVGRAVADAKVARLDAVIGSKLWQRIWLDKGRTTDERIGAIQDLYCSQLRERGFRYANRIPMRDIHGKRARYTLVFATNSAHGIDMMSDIACRYQRELEDDAHEGTFDLLWEENRRDHRVSSLRDDIHRLGLQLGAATPQKLRHQLVADRFGQFTITEYNKAVRTLVAEERIDRPTPKGIKDDEQLRFVSPPQQSMFG